MPLLAGLGALALAAAATAPPAPIPDTPAGRRFADLMALGDAGDAAIAAYVKENFTPEMQKANPGDVGIEAFLARHARDFGGFEVAHALSAEGDQVTMLVRPRRQQNRWFRYIVKVVAAPPHLVEGLFLMPAAPADIPKDGDALTPEDAVAALAREVDRVVDTGRFSGVVLLARGAEIAYQRAAGEANRDFHVPVKADTVFGLASMNKMFTAVALGRLVEQGKIAWSDPVGKHLRGWLPEGSERSITIDQLLTHTAGLGDYLGQIDKDPKLREARSLAPYRELVRASTVEGTPQDGLRYSNTGYLVLGALIEAVSGRDYFTFVREEVYARAGMTRTDSWCRDEVIENRATGYVAPEHAEVLGLGRGWRTNALVQGTRGTSAGGGWSTAGDLLRFARALVEGRLLGKPTVDALLQPRVRFPVGGSYSYGFVVHDAGNGARTYGHSGGFPGVSGELKIYRDGAWTLVVLSNIGGAAGDIVGAWDGIESRVSAKAAP